MSFQDAIRTVLSKYATFSGRALRSEYWWWVLFVVLVSIATGIVDAVLFGFDEMSPQPITWLVSLAFLIPGLAVSARRLHDTGRSGWWLLIMFIPILGFLILLYWTIQKGDEDANSYGAPVVA